MKLLSIEYIPGAEFEALGIVKGYRGTDQKHRQRFYGRYEDSGRWRNRRIHGDAERSTPDRHETYGG